MLQNFSDVEELILAQAVGLGIGSKFQYQYGPSQVDIVHILVSADGGLKISSPRAGSPDPILLTTVFLLTGYARLNGIRKKLSQPLTEDEIAKVNEVAEVFRNPLYAGPLEHAHIIRLDTDTEKIRFVFDDGFLANLNLLFRAFWNARP